MTSRFPWISRASVDEIVAELRREIADHKEEARTIMDLLTYRATGEKVHLSTNETEMKMQRKPRRPSDMSLAERVEVRN